jgi:predicted phage terminase large subunit-like protein
MGRYDTDKGGYRISVGVMASVLGRGGNIKIIDDAMKPDDPESELKREDVLRAYDETLSSRENDPTIAAEIVIAQRLDEKDLPGHILTKYGTDPNHGGWTHLMIPAEYDSSRHCVTVLGWQDPRGCDEFGNMLPDAERALRDGTSFWRERFTPQVIAERKLAERSSYSWSAKYQQAPIPRGGGIIKPEWWNMWPPDGEEFDAKGRPKKPLTYPDMDYIVACLDTALTDKQINDPSGMAVYGIWRSVNDFRQRRSFNDDIYKEDVVQEQLDIYESNPRIMLMDAWSEHLQFHELFNKVVMTCRKRKVDRLIIEAKTAGHSIAQEMRRLLIGESFGIQLETPKGDKDARLRAVSHLFEAGLVYRPDRAWAEKVADQCSAGSKGRHDEMADVTSAALRHLRQIGEASTIKEHVREINNEFGHRPAPTELYDV